MTTHCMDTAMRHIMQVEAVSDATITVEVAVEEVVVQIVAVVVVVVEEEISKPHISLKRWSPWCLWAQNTCTAVIYNKLILDWLAL